jgi:predicted Ser/Thr protein kinase
MKHINCPNCRAKIEILDDDHATLVVTCSHCGSQLTPRTGETTRTLAPEVKGRIDEYVLESELGHGAFGTVWKARDTLLSNFVAIKIPRYENFSDSEKNVFLREAKVMAQLDHPNIVRVRRVIDREELTAIVMDFVRGTNLREYVANHPFQTPREAVELWEKVCRAVHHAHEHGVVHRDLKPSNILITTHHEPLVSDFGLAKADSAEFTVGGDNAVLGNVAHMAPEQAAGRSSDADQRSDVYSLGSILYELLTKRTPFEGSKRSISDLKQNFDPVPPSRYNDKVPRDLDTITTHSMERERDRRYQTAEALADDLRRYLDGKPIVARPVPLFEKAWRWAKRNQSLAAAFSVIGFMGLVLVGMVARNATGGGKGIADGRHAVRIPVTIRQVGADGFLEDRRRDFDAPFKSKLATGARVKFWLRDKASGEPQETDSPDEVRTGRDGYAHVRLLPGQYLVVAQVPGHGFHEVFREVPTLAKQPPGGYRHATWLTSEAGVIELREIDVPPTSAVTKDMVAYDANSSQKIGSENPEFTAHFRPVGGFWIDKDEATISLWRRHLPEVQTAGNADDAITNITYGAAVEFAEWAGKRLPTEFEYETAATNQGTTLFPWGALDLAPLDAAWTFGPVGHVPYDVNKKGVRGLFSNVAEMTETWAILYPSMKFAEFKENPLADKHYTIRGAPLSIGQGAPPRVDWIVGAPARHAGEKTTPAGANVGVRFARSREPRFKLMPPAP